ncbi:hypothetical protein C3388_00710 [Leclercia sp. LSNIH5]|nr:hypothetical protein C3388_00710 [Leclercia sp. LSNIH5]
MPSRLYRSIFLLRLQNQASGLASCNLSDGAKLHLRRATCYTSMVGWTGALQSAPVSLRPVRLTPFSSPPARLASPVVM